VDIKVQIIYHLFKKKTGEFFTWQKKDQISSSNFWELEIGHNYIDPCESQPHLQTQLQDHSRLTFSYISFFIFYLPDAPYRIFLLFLPWLPCHFYLVVIEQQRQKYYLILCHETSMVQNCGALKNVGYFKVKFFTKKITVHTQKLSFDPG